ncbi:MAG TPA: cupredoxin domain-containing protein [Candidatus Limnocylindrales bacterium]
MRTFAMRLVGFSYAAIIAVFVVYATQPFAADFLAVIAGFIVLFGCVGLASVAWSGARTRPWFWLVSSALGLLVLLFNGFYGPYALAHPADALTFVTTLVVLVAGALVVVGSLTAWLEVRRQRPLWEQRGRAGFVAAGLAGLVAGACVTSVVAASAAPVGVALDQPPATTVALTARDTKFLETGLEARSGDVLGVFVTNKDGFAHSFDVDALGIHVPLPADSTTFVAVKPVGAGQLPFYCAVPGHQDAGMVGAISVH